MTPPLQRRSTALLSGGLALFLANIAFAYWAGCTADLKTGSIGSPEQALRFQGLAALSGIISATLLAIGVATASFGRKSGRATGWAILVFLAALLLSAVSGFEAEVQGVQQCVSARR